MSDQIILGDLEAGGPLRCDVATLIDSRALVTGNSGAGKSRLLRRICEQAFGKVQIIVIDPEGEFPTLREKHAFLLAGRGGEVPAEPRAASLLARRLMELRASAVLDLYDLKLPERRGFVRAFLESLMELPRDQYRPVLIIIDEAQLFCPEKGYGEAESSESVIALMTQGRKRGLCGIPATLRLSAFDKTAAAQATNVFVGRTVLDVDQKRAAAVLGITSGPERVALRDLPQGVFLAYGPALLAPGVVRFLGGAIATTHPKAGQRHSAVAPPAPEAVRKVAAELKDLPEQAAEEIRTLQAAKARVRDLERELREAKKGALPATRPERAPRVVEKLILKDRAASRLESSVVTLNAAAARLGEAAQKAEATAASVATQVLEIKAAIAAARAPSTGEVRHEELRPLQGVAGSGPVGRAPVPSRATPAPRHDGISPVEQRVLDALAELDILGVPKPERIQVAFLAGYSNLDSKGFKNATGSLRTADLIAYPTPGTIALTGAGREKANWTERPRTPAELQERIIRLLGGVHGRVLEPLIKAYPEAVAREEVARQAGYGNLDSKGFKNAMGRLRSLGLIDYPTSGQVQAQRVLFLEGAA